MQQIRNFEAVNKVLAKYILAVRNITGKDITLSRMLPLMKTLGNPQQKLKIIHIAGTSGKTSTSYYISALLKQAGYKVGLTVSPHIECISERVQINLEPIEEKQFCENLSEFLEFIKNVDPEPTYFELLIAFVYWYFAKSGVDYAVIETGMGGLHDATNVANRADKICVITDIGYDHMYVLGNTLQLIATQKAGIIHNGNQVFMNSQPAKIIDVIKQRVENKHAKLNVLSNIEDKLDLPEFQQRNWVLAKYVYDYVAQRDELPKLSATQLKASQTVIIPGRMEIHKINDKTIVMDGAHNGQKMRAFVGSFKAKFSNQKATVLFSLKNDKNYAEVLENLLPIASQLIITMFQTSQDLPARPAKPEAIADVAQKLGYQNIIIEPNSSVACQLLLKNNNKLCIITGSFYLLADLHQVILDS